MKKIVIYLFLLALLLTGCHANNINQEEMTTCDVGNILNDEQLKYLTEELHYTKDALSYMSYESLNFELLGTGLELYNQSSGVEKNGIDYICDQETDWENLKCEREDLITYEELRQIRMKEKEIRFEDFVKNGSYTNAGHLLIGIQYTSVTPESMVLKIINYTEDKFMCSDSIEIYKGNDTTGSPIVKSEEKGEISVDSKHWSNVPVSFGAKLEPGQYTIVYGEDVFSATFEVK